jgi:hypothetical protein
MAKGGWLAAELERGGIQRRRSNVKTVLEKKVAWRRYGERDPRVESGGIQKRKTLCRSCPPDSIFVQVLLFCIRGAVPENGLNCRRTASVAVTGGHIGRKHANGKNQDAMPETNSELIRCGMSEQRHVQDRS